VLTYHGSFRNPTWEKACEKEHTTIKVKNKNGPEYIEKIMIITIKIHGVKSKEKIVIIMFICSRIRLYTYAHIFNVIHVQTMEIIKSDLVTFSMYLVGVSFRQKYNILVKFQ